MQQGRTQTRVLVVEDSPTQAKKLEMVLRAVGFDVSTAVDGRRGLEAFRASPHREVELEPKRMKMPVRGISL